MHVICRQVCLLPELGVGNNGLCILPHSSSRPADPGLYNCMWKSNTKTNSSRLYALHPLFLQVDIHTLLLSLLLGYCWLNHRAPSREQTFRLSNWFTLLSKYSHRCLEMNYYLQYMFMSQVQDIFSNYFQMNEFTSNKSRCVAIPLDVGIFYKERKEIAKEKQPKL